MTNQNAENFVKIWRLVSEKFLKLNLFFSGPPFTGGPDDKIFFWVLEGPQLHKKFWAPLTSRFGDMKGQIFNFPTFPQNWVARSPPYFA